MQQRWLGISQNPQDRMIQVWFGWVWCQGFKNGGIGSFIATGRTLLAAARKPKGYHLSCDGPTCLHISHRTNNSAETVLRSGISLGRSSPTCDKEQPHVLWERLGTGRGPVGAEQIYSWHNNNYGLQGPCPSQSPTRYVYLNTEVLWGPKFSVILNHDFVGAH